MFYQGNLRFGSVLDHFCLSSEFNFSCFCHNSFENKEDDTEIVPLSGTEKKLRDIANTKKTLAFQLKPKMVALKVSMHYNGCERKIQKHIAKMDGVTSYQVYLERKKVVVIGDILPFEELEQWTSFAGDETIQSKKVN